MLGNAGNLCHLRYTGSALERPQSSQPAISHGHMSASTGESSAMAARFSSVEASLVKNIFRPTLSIHFRQRQSKRPATKTQKMNPRGVGGRAGSEP